MAAPLLLIDSYSQIYRGFYAVRSLTTAQGVPSNAVFAMAKLLLKFAKEYGEYDGAFVFDKGRPAQRMALAPAYKANRPPMPEELRCQLDPIRELIRAFGWNIIEWEGVEADDLIGAFAKKFTDRNVMIVSSDKDISQVIDDRIQMLVPDHDGKGFSVRGVAETVAKLGVGPDTIIDYIELNGDSSDNIPGVEGVGPKTAAALLNQFVSAEAMLSRAAEIKRDSLREKVLASSEILALNRKLIALDLTVPSGLVLTEESFARREPDYKKIMRLLRTSESIFASWRMDFGPPIFPFRPSRSRFRRRRRWNLIFDRSRDTVSHGNENRRKLMKRRLFTLVEMLVVIGIIGILAGIAIPVVLKMKDKGKETQARADINSIQLAIKQYEADYGTLRLFNNAAIRYLLRTTIWNNMTKVMEFS